METQNTDTAFLQATGADFLLGNRFLKLHKQATAGRQDRLFLVKQDQTIVGAAWLRVSEDTLWLRSLFVTPEYRHQKLASQLLTTMKASTATTPIICLAKPELSEFYLNNGFRTIVFEALSSELQKRFAPYCRQHPAWQIFISG